MDTTPAAAEAPHVHHSRDVGQEAAVGGDAEAVMPMLEAVMDEAKLDFAELDLIAATLGPGSFTGIRVCAAMAQGLAFAQRLPTALEELPRDCGCLVVLKGAVAGVTPHTVDLTAQLRQKVGAP